MRKLLLLCLLAVAVTVGSNSATPAQPRRLLRDFRLPQLDTTTISRIRPAFLEGSFVVAWSYNHSGCRWPNSQRGIYQVGRIRFDARGQLISGSEQVNTRASGQHVNPAIAIDWYGNYLIPWEDDSNDNDVYQIHARGYRRNDARWLREFTVNTRASGHQRKPDIAMTHTGESVIVWEDDHDENGFYQVRVRGLRNDGTPLFRERTVNPVERGQQRNPGVAVAPNGHFVVVWEDDRDENDYYQIYVRGFNADGTERFAERVVNQVSDGQQLAPDVAIAPNGDCVVVWADRRTPRSGYDIYARGFRSDGAQMFPEVRINASASAEQLRPAIAMAANGEFVVAWDDYNSGASVMVRGFHANGQERFSERTVNGGLAGASSSPDISMSSDGAFVVSWTQEVDLDCDRQVVYVRGYAVDGSAAFDPVRAATAEGNLAISKVAMCP